MAAPLNEDAKRSLEADGRERQADRPERTRLAYERARRACRTMDVLARIHELRRREEEDSP